MAAAEAEAAAAGAAGEGEYTPGPVQIINIVLPSEEEKKKEEKKENEEGKGEGYVPSSSFTLCEENLRKILDRVPPRMPVAVVAVVGAFRTGKSFLLNFFLRRLRYMEAAAVAGGEAEEKEEDPTAWMTAEGSMLREGNSNKAQWSDATTRSFAWRGGYDRETTGIWMWSEPFVLPASHATRMSFGAGVDKIAVLLVDTQGMYDNQTDMALTASIFGMSTLMASYQVYNVEKRIQEDNLWHLALFSEYGRMALSKHDPGEGDEDDAAAVEEDVLEGADVPKSDDDGLRRRTGSDTDGSEKKEPETKQQPAAEMLPPFQRLEFLIRDWQDFEEEDDLPAMEKEINQYLKKVIQSSTNEELDSTREQIKQCFQKISCAALPHPGTAVTKKNYDGDIDKIEEIFKLLLDRYVRRIFEHDVEPKVIGTRAITATELYNYILAYGRLFCSNDQFPEPKTVLRATIDATNENAKALTLATYREGMDTLAGPDEPHLHHAVFARHEADIRARALAKFDSIATMGSSVLIRKARERTEAELENDHARYRSLNEHKNPYKDMEYIIVPLVVALLALIIDKFLDATCLTDFCRATSDGFERIYLFVFTALVAFTALRFHGMYKRVKDVLPMVTNAATLVTSKGKAHKE